MKVDVQDVGTIEFPDEATPQEISSFLNKNFSKNPLAEKSGNGQPASASQIDISPLNRGVFQPSQFSSGMIQPTSGNPDTALTSRLSSEFPGDVMRFVPEQIENVGATILNAPATLTGQRPVFTPGKQAIPAPDKTPITNPNQSPFIQGIVDSIATQLTGMTTPGNIATLGVGSGLGKISQEAATIGNKLLATYFGGEMVSALPEAAKNAIGVFKDPNSTAQDKGNALATVGGAAGLATLLIKHAGKVEPTRIPDYNGSSLRLAQGALPPEEIPTVALDPQTGNPIPPAAPKAVTQMPIEQDIKTFNLDEPVAETQLNPGGSKADLPPELQAQSKANNSRAAFEALARERGSELPAQEQSIEAAKNPTAMRFQLIDQERQKRGLEPLLKSESVSDQETMNKAMAEIDKNPTLPETLIQSLKENPRAVKDWELHALLLRKIDLTKDFENAAKESTQLREQSFSNPELKGDAEEANLRANILSDKLSELESVSKLAGREQGAGLRAFRIMANEDYSLAAMEAKKRLKKGEPLTQSERSELVKKANDFSRINSELESKLAEKERVVQQFETSRQLNINPAILRVAEKIGQRLHERADAARVRLKEKSFRLNAGVDPTILVDLAEIGASHLYDGALEFSKWSAKMIQDFGEDVTPLLKDVFIKSRSLYNKELDGRPKAREAISKLSKRTPEEIALKSLKTRTKNQISELETRLETKNFSKRTKRETQLDKEASDLRFKLEKIKRQFNEELLQDQLKNRSTPKKIFGTAVEALNTFRAIKTSIDLSAVRRQAGFITLAHPVRAVKAFPDMFKALKSEKEQFAVEEQIQGRENYPLYKKSGLYLHERGSSLAKMEEAYMSRWADKIPGVAASQRAYTTFLNRIRADSFDAMAKTLSKTWELNGVEAKAIANFVNVATGRGALGLKENALVGLNTVFFAPRYVASRFQLLAGQPLYGGTKATRLLIAKEYARYLTGIAVLYGLARSSGATVELDPRSSEFGKIKIGNTRIDPLSGLQQVTVLASRLASGETKNSKGKITPTTGNKVPFGSPSPFDLMARFARTKLAPAPGLLIDLLAKKDVVGNPVTAQSVTSGLVTPLALSDIYQAMKSEGIPTGIALGIVSIFGDSLQTYSNNQKSK